MISDNPAARLLKVLEEGRRISGKNSCRETWLKLLEVEDNDSALLMSRMGKLMELPAQAIALLASHFPNQVRTIHHWQNQVTAAFSDQNLNSSWQTFRQHIDDHTLTYLSLTADLLAQKVNSQTLPSETLKSLKNQVDDLLEQVIASDLEESVRTSIARHLQKLSIAIADYRISGALNIMDVVEGAFGHSFFDKKYHDSLTKTEIGSAVVSVLSAVSSAMSIALGAPQLAESAKLLLEQFK